MTEDEAVKSILEKTRDTPHYDGAKKPIGSMFTCGCCIDEDYVVEKLEPLFRLAFQAGKKSHD